MSSTTEIKPHTKTIPLKTADGKLFSLAELVAMEFKIVKSFLDDNPGASFDAIVPLLDVNSEELAKINGYYKANWISEAAVSPPRMSPRLQGTTEEVLGEADEQGIESLILAANYLDIVDLLDVVNQEATDRIKK
ncbi:hypothetical protein SLA2020_331490 [Shorea laevis]